MTIPSPTVSIAIPLYNCESYIRETIESVLAQTYTEFKLMVLDDQSSDRSAEIVKSFRDPRIEYKLNPERLGFFGNWNRCLEVMEGTYCKLLPHDDTLEPTCLEKQVKVLDEHPEVELVHCARKIIDPAGNLLTTRRPPRESQGVKESNSSLRLIIRSGTNPIGEPAAVMFRNTTKNRIDGFSNADIYTIDVEYWSRLLAEGNRYYLNEALSSFRIWPNSASLHLFGSQSRSIQTFTRNLRNRFPNIIRPADVAIGTIKSPVLEMARGIVYLLMKLKKRKRGDCAGVDHDGGHILQSRHR